MRNQFEVWRMAKCFQNGSVGSSGERWDFLERLPYKNINSLITCQENQHHRPPPSTLSPAPSSANCCTWATPTPLITAWTHVRWRMWINQITPDWIYNKHITITIVKTWQCSPVFAHIQVKEMSYILLWRQRQEQCVHSRFFLLQQNGELLRRALPFLHTSCSCSSQKPQQRWLMRQPSHVRQSITAASCLVKLAPA